LVEEPDEVGMVQLGWIYHSRLEEEEAEANRQTETKLKM